MKKLTNIQFAQYTNIDNRIKSLTNQGKEICGLFVPVEFNAVSCQYCGYHENIHYLRDARNLIVDLLNKLD